MKTPDLRQLVIPRVSQFHEDHMRPSKPRIRVIVCMPYVIYQPIVNGQWETYWYVLHADGTCYYRDLSGKVKLFARSPLT